MGSLKAFLPMLAGFVGTTPDALYTRQRALVDLGLVTYKPGRGPGSGTPVSGDNVAALIIALMTADTLQETDERVKMMCEAAPAGRHVRCPWTGQKNLQSALGHVLTSKQHRDSFASLVVYRGKGAQLLYGRPNDSSGSVFRHADSNSLFSIMIDARIEARFLHNVFAALQAEAFS